MKKLRWVRLAQLAVVSIVGALALGTAVPAVASTEQEAVPATEKELIAATEENQTASPEADLFWPDPATGQSIQATITCRIQVDNPHPSAHVPGRINVVARVRCTAPVAGIAMRIGLFKGSPRFKLVSTRVASNRGVAALTINTTAPCDPDFYFGSALAMIVPPLGYFPPVAVVYVRSSGVIIVC